MPAFYAYMFCACISAWKCKQQLPQLGMRECNNRLFICTRFNATSPFAGHTEEPITPRQTLPSLFVLNEDLQQPSTSASRMYTRISSMPQDFSRRAAGYANARSSSLRLGRNGSPSKFDATSSSGRMASIQRQMSLSLRQVSCPSMISENPWK